MHKQRAAPDFSDAARLNFRYAARLDELVPRLDIVEIV